MTTGAARPVSLGRYRIVDVIGAGAMGVVYTAHDPRIDRTVALKTIRRELLSTQVAGEVVARFHREAKAAGRLSHPGIVAVYDYGEDENTSYIVMEYAPGMALSEVAGEGRCLPAHEARALLLQLLDGLEYAHAQGIVHRDIKPSNLLISSDGRLKITDFGIARIDGGRLTRTGTPVGTPVYMAPEIYLGESGDHRADLYSAGVVLYELLTGALPFEGATIAALAYKVCHTAHVPPSRRGPGLAAGFDRVIDRALAKRADARYANARAFADDVLQAALPSAGMSPRAIPIGDEVLRKLESALAGILGPIAGVIVRRDAGRATNGTELEELLAQHAASPEESALVARAVRTVLEGVSRATGAPSSARATRKPTPAPEGAPAAPLPSTGSISSEDIEGMTSDLTAHVGPIARLLVKRALASSLDVHELRRNLAQHIADESERRRWLER